MDAGVIQLVHVDRVVAAYQRSQRSQVGLVTGAVDQRGFLAHEVGQLFLQAIVEIEIAVQKSASGIAGSVLVDGLPGRLHHPRVVRQPHVVVGADHELLLSVDHHVRVVGLVDPLEVRIQSGSTHLTGGREVLTFVEQVHLFGLIEGSLVRSLRLRQGSVLHGFRHRSKLPVRSTWSKLRRQGRTPPGNRHDLSPIDGQKSYGTSDAYTGWKARFPRLAAG